MYSSLNNFLQVIKDYDFDQDGKLNMAEYRQYKSDSSDKSSEETNSNKIEEDILDSDDGVVYKELKT